MLRRLSPFLLLAASLPAGAEEPWVQAEPWAFRMDLAQVRIPATAERITFTGLSLLAETASGFYLGPSLQAAVRGQRGGFFAGGLEGGLRLPLGARTTLDGGLFLGGGGGGGAPVGGGLLLRPRLGVEIEREAFRLGAGVERLLNPNGEVTSTQGYVTLARTFTSLGLTGPGTGRAWPASLAVQAERETWELGVARYTLSAGHFSFGEAEPRALEVPELTWRRDLAGPGFFQVEGGAAAHGGAAGYMEVLAGFGGRIYLDAGQRFALRGVVSAGSGGGGGAGTGGGFLVKGAGGIQLQVTPAVHLFAEAGRLAAPSTSFRATTFTLGTGFCLDALVPGGASGTDLAGWAPEVQSWRLDYGLQRYASVPRLQGAAAGPLEQVVLKGDLFLSGHVFLTGQSAWATGGRGGAWAMGLLGLGAQTPALAGHSLRAEVALGAGGGGGVDSRGGALAQGLAGWNWDCSRSWSVHLLGGAVRSLSGGMTSPVVEAGMSFRGGRPVAAAAGR